MGDGCGYHDAAATTMLRPPRWLRPHNAAATTMLDAAATTMAAALTMLQPLRCCDLPPSRDLPPPNDPPPPSDPLLRKFQSEIEITRFGVR
jgi:hypothetical protein